MAEGIEEEPELGARILFGEANGTEHARLQIALVDTDGAASDFVSVEDLVVGAGAHRAWVGFEAFEIFCERTRERVVGGGQFALVGTLEKGKFRDPAEFPLVGGNGAHLVRDVQAKRAEHRVHQLARTEL